MCQFENNPGIVRVTRKSVDTLTEGVGVCAHPGLILG